MDEDFQEILKSLYDEYHEEESGIVVWPVLEEALIEQMGMPREDIREIFEQLIFHREVVIDHAISGSGEGEDLGRGPPGYERRPKIILKFPDS